MPLHDMSSVKSPGGILAWQTPPLLDLDADPNQEEDFKEARHHAGILQPCGVGLGIAGLGGSVRLGLRLAPME